MSEAWSWGGALTDIVVSPVDQSKLLGEFWVDSQRLGGFGKFAKVVLVIILTNSYTYAFKLENRR